MFFGFIAFVLIFLMPFASADIILSKPKSVYNLGENLDIDFKVYELQSFNGIAELKIECRNQNNEKKELPFFRNAVKINSGEEKNFIVQPLVFDENMLGECSVKAMLEDYSGNSIASSETPSFIVSNKINITTIIEKSVLLPGNTLKITGKAVKESGEKTEGIAKIIIDKEYSEVVKGSFFDSEITLSDRIKSGNHTIKIIVEDDNKNRGEKEETITIKAIPTLLETEFNKKMFLPREKLELKASLFDQANDLIDEIVSISMTSINDKSIISKTINSGSTLEYELPETTSPGDWDIEIYSAGLTKTDVINIEEVEEIDIDLVNNVLYIKNTGNVPYEKDVWIDFTNGEGVITETKQLSLKPGESEEYVLNAPDGKYDILVESGENKESFAETFLTGHVVDVEKLSDVRRNSVIRDLALILGILTALILVIISVDTHRISKIIRKNTQRKMFEKEETSKYIERMKSQGRVIPAKEDDEGIFWK